MIAESEETMERQTWKASKVVPGKTLPRTEGGAYYSE